MPSAKSARRSRTEPFTPKRGRPTATQSAAIARSIIGAATHVFVSEGFEGASMEAIALRAGVPKSTLYKRFADKRVLLRAVLNERISVWSAPEKEQDLGNDLETRLKNLAADILQRAVSAEVQTFWSLVANAWPGPGEAANRHEAIGYSKMVARLVSEIQEHGPRAGIKARRPDQAASALMAMLAGWIEFVGPAGEMTEQDAVQFAHTAVDLMIHGSAAW